MTTPTVQTYQNFDDVYDLLNQRLFNGILPRCMITMQRSYRYYGFFSGERWASNDDSKEIIVTDEIALNPSYFATQTMEEVVSTLVHEMVHLWQYRFGDPGRRGYHNREWATFMEKLGLMPSSTGEPGGDRTGQHMSHYIIENGPFAAVCRDLKQSGFIVPYVDRAGPIVKPLSKVKYTCPECSANAWAKPDSQFICGFCYDDTRQLIRLKPVMAPSPTDNPTKTNAQRSEDSTASPLTTPAT